MARLLKDSTLEKEVTAKIVLNEPFDEQNHNAAAENQHAGSIWSTLCGTKLERVLQGIHFV